MSGSAEECDIVLMPISSFADKFLIAVDGFSISSMRDNLLQIIRKTLPICIKADHMYSGWISINIQDRLDRPRIQLHRNHLAETSSANPKRLILKRVNKCPWEFEHSVFALQHEWRTHIDHHFDVCIREVHLTVIAFLVLLKHPKAVHIGGQHWYRSIYR